MIVFFLRENLNTKRQKRAKVHFTDFDVSGYTFLYCKLVIRCDVQKEKPYGK